MSLNPRLSPNGLSVVTQAPWRFFPGWLDDARWLAARGNGPGLYSSDERIDLDDWPEPDSITVGGGGFAANYWNATIQGVKHSSGLVFAGGYHGTLSDTGQLAYLTGHDPGQLQVLRDTQGSEYDSGARLEYPRACGAGVGWSKYEDGRQKTWYADWRGTKQRVHASGALAEFRPVPVVTPFGVWIVTYTHTDVRGYKVGTTRGFIRACLNGRAIDGKWNGRGLRIVWNGEHGELFDEVIDLAGPMVALDVPIVVPPPPPPPPPPPQIPKVTISSYQETVTATNGSRAVATITQGKENAQKFLWRYRQSATPWTVVARNRVVDVDHTFFRNDPAKGLVWNPGIYYIGVDVTGADGQIADGTRTQRTVTVTA